MGLGAYLHIPGCCMQGQPQTIDRLSRIPLHPPIEGAKVGQHPRRRILHKPRCDPGCDDLGRFWLAAKFLQDVLEGSLRPVLEVLPLGDAEKVVHGVLAGSHHMADGLLPLAPHLAGEIYVLSETGTRK